MNKKMMFIGLGVGGLVLAIIIVAVIIIIGLSKGKKSDDSSE